MSPAQTVTAEWTVEKCLDKRVQSKQSPKHKVGNRTDGRKCRQTIATQAADSLRRRANAPNVSFRISLRWPIYITNPVDKTKLAKKKKFK